MTLADARREYSLAGLDRDDLAPEPLTQFAGWFAEASSARGRTRLRRIGIAFFDLWHALVGHPPIDVNAAGAAELMRLPGVGPVMAQNIIKAREEKRFESVADLNRVKGIGPKTLDRLRPFVVVK